MGIKIKHTDPTLNSFSTDDLVINVRSGSLFFKSNSSLFKVQGNDVSSNVITGSINSFDGIVGIGMDVGDPSFGLHDGTDSNSTNTVGLAIRTSNEAIRIVDPEFGNTHIGWRNPSSAGTYFTIPKLGNSRFSFRTFNADTTTHGSSILHITSSNRVGINTQTPTGVAEFRNTEIDSGAAGAKAASNVYLVASNQGNLDEERYYLLATILDNNGHLSIKGILAGHEHDQGNAEIDIKISQRDSGATSYPYVTGTINGQIGTAADIITTDDSSNQRHKIYLKTGKYSLINLDLKTTQGVTLVYDPNTFITAANFTETIRFGFNAHDDTAGYVPYYYYKLRPYSSENNNQSPNYYTPNVTNFNAANDLATGWYTIATSESGRTQGRFHILDTNSGQHQAFVFYATHMYGRDNSNTINVVSFTSYDAGSGGVASPLSAIRIKDLGTYDGAVLQVYINQSQNELQVSLLDDLGINGWRLKNFIPDATDPGGVSRASNSTNGTTSAYSQFTDKAKIEITDLKNGGTGTTSHFYVGKDLDVVGTLSKGAGSFKIDHPDPIKTNTHHLYHNFVESPTEGDNIYRWTITTINKTHTIILPDYYKFLNKNDMVWVSAVDHFGRAYGTINDEQTKLTITSDTDGKYNVLLIGTRKDKFIQDNYQGVEVLK